MRFARLADVLQVVFAIDGVKTGMPQPRHHVSASYLEIQADQPIIVQPLCINHFLGQGHDLRIEVQMKQLFDIQLPFELSKGIPAAEIAFTDDLGRVFL